MAERVEVQRRLAHLESVHLGRMSVDEVEIPSPTGGEPLRRVPEVIDVWFDSGSMPFAQEHAPFENEERFRELGDEVRPGSARPRNGVRRQGAQPV